ncbi:unnamed protein product [Tenebrio molitor]|nr:unnamed protein product [Tenebrio molitor]
MHLFFQPARLLWTLLNRWQQLTLNKRGSIFQTSGGKLKDFAKN